MQHRRGNKTTIYEGGRFQCDFGLLVGILGSMRRDASKTRDHILRSAYTLFYREGFERTGVDAIAEAAGVTKRTLYNHFPSKDDLIAEMLVAQVNLAAQNIQRWWRSGPGTTEEVIRAVFGELRDWASSSAWRGSGFSRAALELAWAPGHPVRQAASRQKTIVQQSVAEALSKAGSTSPERLACALVVLFEGAMVMRLIHGDQVWIDIAEDAAHGIARDLDAVKR